MSLKDRTVLHIDFDYFYAQCEEIRRPTLKVLPVCVCIYSDRGGGSGAIATANYTARKYGVRSGMSIHTARHRLNGAGAEFLAADFEYYSAISEKAMRIMEGYADVFEYVGRDEAYLDVTKRCDGDLYKASHLAQQLKNSIQTTLSMSCSVGISPNRLLSKMASAHHKPDGLTIVTTTGAVDFLDSAGPAAVPGIGGKTARRLASMGAIDMPGIRRMEIFDLQKAFGRKVGTRIYNCARGIDDTPVQPRPSAIQCSRIVTLRHDISEAVDMETDLARLCGDIWDDLSARNTTFRQVGIQLIYNDMSNRVRSRTLRNHTANRAVLTSTANDLLHEAMQDSLPVRRLGVRVSDLSVVCGQQDITDYF